MQARRRSPGGLQIVLLPVAAVLGACLPSRGGNTSQTAPPAYGLPYNQPSPYGQPSPYVQPAQPEPPVGSPPAATAAAPTAPTSPFPFPVPGMPAGWGFPTFPGVTPTAAPTASPTSSPTVTPGPGPTTTPPAGGACPIVTSPQAWRTTLVIGASTGMCNQRPRLDGNLTIRATGATSAHVEWNGGEYTDEAVLDPTTCTVSHGPPGKTQNVQGVTGHATYRVSMDPSGRLAGTAHVIVDIPFATCQADYTVSGTK